MVEIPAIGSTERNQHEADSIKRAKELIHECDGSLRDALHDLERELRGNGRYTVPILTTIRKYSRELVYYVEQCWASAIVG